MGEIAEAMLDGTLCEGCGCYIGDGCGFPQYCGPQCAADRGADYSAAEAPKKHNWRVGAPGSPQPHGMGLSAKARARRRKREAAVAAAGGRA